MCFKEIAKEELLLPYKLRSGPPVSESHPGNHGPHWNPTTEEGRSTMAKVFWMSESLLISQFSNNNKLFLCTIILKGGQWW